MPDKPALRLRCLAATFHFISSIPIGLLAMGISYVTLSLSVPDFLTIGYIIPESISTYLNIHGWALIAGSWLGAFLINVQLWLLSKKWHRFVDEAARDALNSLINVLIAIAFGVVGLIFVFYTTCGMGAKDMTAIGVSLIVIALGIIAYFINTIVAGVFALRGSRWVNSLIFPIIPTAR
jgi:uncharacterized Tic20 family protein